MAVKLNNVVFYYIFSILPYTCDKVYWIFTELWIKKKKERFLSSIEFFANRKLKRFPFNILVVKFETLFNGKFFYTIKVKDGKFNNEDIFEYEGFIIKWRPCRTSWKRNEPNSIWLWIHNHIYHQIKQKKNAFFINSASWKLIAFHKSDDIWYFITKQLIDLTFNVK